MAKKYLVVNADDFGLCPSTNYASFLALAKGCVTSLSIMAPAPYFKQAVSILHKHNMRHVGVHLTLTSEFSKLRYGPISFLKEVPSLIDNKGYFPKTIYYLSKHARQEEVKIELENQIKKVIKHNLIPTHLDCHMFALHYKVLKRTDFLPVILYLCRKFNLPFRSPFLKEKNFLKKNNIKVLYRSFKGSYDIPARKKKIGYDNWLKRLPCSVSELILHCGYDNPSLRTITKRSLRRQADYDYAVSKSTLSLLKKEKIKLLPWEKVPSYLK